MASSTLRLSEYAKSFVFPSSIVKTVWPRVEAKGRDLDLGFDWWQQQAGTVMLGYRDDGKYAATVGGVGMSIPRQVGKTYFVLAMLVILCILFPGLQVVWTAHHLRTSTKTFTTLRGMCRRRKIAPYIKPGGIRSANGEQQVEFVNGSMIMFGARSQGFGRGFDEIDVEVFDEAQILDTKALEDMIAATNQARHPHGALLFFMGTPPRSTDPSEAFAQRRKAALAGETDDAVWLEIGADPESDLDDKLQWPAMNPSFPLRTPEESLLRLRKNLSDDEAWNREGRGIWDAEETGGAIPAAKWLSCADATGKIAGAVAFCIDVALDRSAASIAVVGAREDGRWQGELIRTGRGTAWLADVAKEAALQWHGPVVLDAAGPAASLQPELEAAGVEVVPLTRGDVVKACGYLLDAVTEKTFTHLDDPDLNKAVRGARAKGGESFVFTRKGDTDISPLYAVTLALWHAASAGQSVYEDRGLVTI